MRPPLKLSSSTSNKANAEAGCAPLLDDGAEESFGTDVADEDFLFWQGGGGGGGVLDLFMALGGADLGCGMVLQTRRSN